MADKLGPIMLLQLGQVPALVVSSVDMAREILKTQDHIFSSRPSLKVPKTFLYEGRDVAFAPYGEYWRQARKMCVFHLLSPKMVQSYKLIREEEVALMIEAISRSCSSGTVLNMSEDLNCLAKNIISRTALGNCPREEEWYNMFHAVIHECSKMMGAFHVADYFPSLSWLGRLTGLDARVEKLFKKVDEILDAIVDDHINRSTHDKHKTDNFIDILLSLEMEGNKCALFGKEDIKAIVEDLFGAGTESIFVTMEWVLADLIRNPEARKRLKDEIRGIVGSKPMVKEEDLDEMSYLKAVIKESMRLHPPGPFLVPRELIEDTKITGYFIPRRTRIFVNVWAIQRDPKIWEAPEEFRPERFMGSSVDFKGHDFQLIPFGAGRRICPGIGFAVPVLELAIANLMHRFDWKLPNGMKEEDMDMAEAFGLTMSKKSALQLVATPCLC